MPGRNNSYIENLLNLMNNRVHRRTQQHRVFGENVSRVLSEASDDTSVGSNNEPDNLITNDIHILDCGHTYLGNNLGGQCHYCDKLICRHCILICCSCGHALCPQHTVIANFDYQNKPYCRACAKDISRKIKMKAVRRTFFSFFVSDGDGGGK